jgi:CubicO group peptidase (beta-lactamase class C family)
MRILFFMFLVSLSSCWVMRAYKVRKLQLTDHEKLPFVRINASNQPFRFIQGNPDSSCAGLSTYLDSLLPSTHTAAFLVIRNDSIIYEKYYDGFHAASLLPSNSMAKSFTSTLLSIALDEGKIRSLSEPITNYLPELAQRDSRFCQITIQHLLDMRSGFAFREGRYDLKDESIRLGLKRNLEKNLLKVKIAQPPGKFRYQSINTQLLGLIVERATGERLFTYLEKKLWKPLGAEHQATWNVDSRKRKQVLTSAGLNATIRDFAKLGRLYLNKGKWEGRQVINESWVSNIASIDSMQTYGGYKNQWWSKMASRSFRNQEEALDFQSHTHFASPVSNVQQSYNVNYRIEAFSAIGFMNQTIFVYPKKQLIIVRLGKRWGRSEVFNRFIYNLGEQF